MYYVFLLVGFLCFVYHTMDHVLENLGIIKGNKLIYAGVGVAMFFGWFSYFYISFNDPIPLGVWWAGYLGMALVMTGFYLFIISHHKVHKRMHTGKGNLITDGIYKHLRHPMYLGEILILLGAPILGQGMLTLMLSPLFIGQILIWRHLEERVLIREFPQYKEYKKRTWF